jgi:hypothetical protein
MSGIRHHFIPQFLLRGFASRSTAKATSVWVLPRDGAAYQSNIKNVAVEGHFYTLDGSPHIDDAITGSEARWAALIDAMREQPDQPVDPAAAAELVAHLEVRTRHLRKSFESLATGVTERFVDLADDADTLGRVLLAQIYADPDQLLDPLLELLRAEGMQVPPKADLWEALRPIVPAFVEHGMHATSAELSGSLRRALDDRGSMLRRSAQTGQLRGLEQGLAPAVKVAAYTNLTFTVQRAPCEQVLGDSAVLFEVASGRRFTSFYSTDDGLLAAYLPLTPQLVLVGCAPGHQPVIEGLPAVVAQVASEYIVAASMSEPIQALRPAIGQLASLFEAQMMDAVFSDLLKSND